MAGVQEVVQILSNLKEADNTIRNHAEAGLKHLRSAQSQQLFASLHQIVTSPATDQNHV